MNVVPTFGERTSQLALVFSVQHLQLSPPRSSRDFSDSLQSSFVCVGGGVVEGGHR